MARAGGAARARYNAPTRPSAVENPTDAQHLRAIADDFVTFARLQAMTPVQMTKAVVVAVLVLSGCGGRPASTVARRADWAMAPAGASVMLPARVTFDAMQLGIENRDTRSWREVVVEVRRPGDARIYRYRADVIVGGRTLLMGALNFATDDGARLSPFSGAPTEWRIQAALPDGVRGWASGAIAEVAPR
jgi:hypothetical protein